MSETLDLVETTLNLHAKVNTRKFPTAEYQNPFVLTKPVELL